MPARELNLDTSDDDIFGDAFDDDNSEEEGNVAVGDMVPSSGIEVTLHIPANLWNITGAANAKFMVADFAEVVAAIHTWKAEVVDVLNSDFPAVTQAQPQQQQSQPFQSSAPAQSSGNSWGGGQQRTGGNPNRPATDKQKDYIRTLCGQKGVQLQEVVDKFGGRGMSSAQAAEAITALKAMGGGGYRDAARSDTNW